MKVVSVVGARPNFIKAAPLVREMRRYPDVSSFLVHTGQHYDERMAGQFFRELELPEPDVALGIGSGSGAFQIAEVMRRLEPVLEANKPDIVLVVGDVNSTLGAALTAAKCGIPVAHVEAGLRSFDRSMPEEVNRVLTDAISEHLFVTEQSGCDNLAHEGVPPARIHLVGNVMIDSLDALRPLWKRSGVQERLGVEPRAYGVLTLHRPANVDDDVMLQTLIAAVAEVARETPIVFPVHPRTRARLTTGDGPPLLHWGHGDRPATKGILCVEPLGYVDFIALVAGARLVLTDSGGLQEETTALGVPCLTLRDNTERPITVTHGTNQVVGRSADRILEAAFCVMEGSSDRQVPPRPPLWDGRAAQRIVAALRRQAGSP
jgi:UDP-N-acetylglucosamine 2-epimerase (non-hydrolysing)